MTKYGEQWKLLPMQSHCLVRIGPIFLICKFTFFIWACNKDLETLWVLTQRTDMCFCVKLFSSVKELKAPKKRNKIINFDLKNIKWR